jgi:hypothetical protein
MRNAVTPMAPSRGRRGHFVADAVPHHLQEEQLLGDVVEGPQGRVDAGRRGGRGRQGLWGREAPVPRLRSAPGPEDDCRQEPAVAQDMDDQLQIMRAIARLPLCPHSPSPLSQSLLERNTASLEVQTNPVIAPMEPG